MPSPSMYNSHYPNEYQNLLPVSNRDECIIGYRVWKLLRTADDVYLTSATRDFHWPYRKPMKRDLIQNMGIHALKSGCDLIQLCREYQAEVVGEVYLWGRVEEFEEGYLSDYAYPKRLAVHSGSDPLLILNLEDGYGVPCDMRDELPRPMTAAELLKIEQEHQQRKSQHLIYYSAQAAQAQAQAQANAAQASVISGVIITTGPSPSAAIINAADPLGLRPLGFGRSYLSKFGVKW